MEGRARDERHHGRRGPLLRQFLGIRTEEQTAAPPAGSVPASATTAPGPLLRRTSGPLDQHRGVRGAPAGRRRRSTTSSYAAGLHVHPGEKVGSGPAGSSPGSGWPSSESGPGRALPILPPELMLLPPSVPAEHLRLRLLGPPDGRRADRDQRPPPGSRALHRHRRARCRTGSRRRATL